MQGKIDLYEWIKKQKGVSDVVLEGWIPETKQRPDIMFTYGNKLWVIEYQCSPIATEYVERHELYQAAGIHDIWICGTEKYLEPFMREKYLQSESVGFYDSTNKYFFALEGNKIYSLTNFKAEKYCHSQGTFYGLPLDDFIFKGTIINVYIGDAISAMKRKELHLQNEKPRKKYTKNRYLRKQKELLKNELSRKIVQLSNNNWSFYVDTFRINKKYKRCIVAEPFCLQSVRSFVWSTILNYTLEKIDIDKLDFFVLQKCVKNPEFLKKFLIPIMQHNRQALLTYESDEYRFLEVTHE